MIMRNVLFVVLTMISTSSYATGPYDGIWALFPYGYVTISERDNTLIAVTLVTDDDEGAWAAYQGPRNGNTARLQTIFGRAQAVVDVNFDSDTTSKITIVSCAPDPGYICAFPVGSVLNVNKVW